MLSNPHGEDRGYTEYGLVVVLVTAILLLTVMSLMGPTIHNMVGPLVKAFH